MYQAKTLFTGYRLGIKSSDLFVGVPNKYLDSEGKVLVKWNEEVREFQPKDIVESWEFNDKFSDGKYTLNYYLWKKR